MWSGIVINAGLTSEKRGRDGERELTSLQLKPPPAKRDGFGHESPYEGETESWITPKYIVDALGEFDLDPCECIPQPWRLAKNAYTIQEDGLSKEWFGRVWCNPPYGPKTHTWIEKMAKHGNGIALIFARVETALYHDVIFPTADGYLFPRGRISFYRPDGTKPKSTSGAPSVLIAWGSENRAALIEACDSGAIGGAYMDLAFYTGSREYMATEPQRLMQEQMRLA
jgi:hypothetical protein